MKKQVDPKVRLAAHLNKKRKKFKVVLNKEVVMRVTASDYQHALAIAQADFPNTTLQIKQVALK